MRLRPGVPVLRGPDGSTHVGWATRLNLGVLSERDAAAVEGLEASHLITASADVAAPLAHTLTRAGLLEPSGPHHGRATPAQALTEARVLVRGLTAVGRACARALAECGAGTLMLDDPAPVRPRHSSHAAGTATRAGQLAKHLTGMVGQGMVGQGIAEQVPVGQVTVGARGPQHADLGVVVATALPVTMVRDLMAADLPHLIVTCDEDGATVGPLVVPGSTPCAMCLALHAADDDPDWPALALQYATRTPAVTPIVAHVAGALAAEAIVAHLGGEDRNPWRVDSAGVSTVAMPEPHPDCGCGASGGRTDDVASRRSRRD
jgi:hypothetical protein